MTKQGGFNPSDRSAVKLVDGELVTRLSTLDGVPRDVLTPLTPHLALPEPPASSPSNRVPPTRLGYGATLPVDDLIRDSSLR